MDARDWDKIRQKSVTITVTHDCNLSCKYCYERNRELGSMDFDTAYNIISKELSKNDDFELVMIDFFGGEPFLQFDLIRKLVAKIRSEEWKKKYLFSTSTNGTLVHGNIQDWLVENRDCFACGLSYDGTEEMQNINRDNSADDIDLDFFLKQYGDQTIKMTISKETLPNLFKGVEFLHQKGFEVACNLAYGIDWSDESNMRILERELNKLIAFYIENPDVEPCSMLNMGIDTVALGTDKAIRFCGCGIEMITYDVDGESYPCHFFMPLSAGIEKASKANEIVFYDEEIPNELVEEKCRSCVVKSICPTCYGSNYVSFGDIYRHDDGYCRLTKAIIKARSYFKGKQWEAGQLKLSKDEERLLLKSILIIQERL